jgi:hypothetical protein
MNQNGELINGSSLWFVGHLRVSLFSSFGEFTKDPREVWSKIGPADNFLGYQELPSPAGVTHQIAGRIDKQILNVTISPARVDLVAAADVTQSSNPSWPFSNEVTAMVKGMHYLAEKLLVAFDNNLSRCACAAQLVRRFENHEAVIEELRKKFPGWGLEPGDLDVVFQRGFVRQFPSWPQPLNIIKKWSEGNWQVLEFSATPKVVASSLLQFDIEANNPLLAEHFIVGAAASNLIADLVTNVVIGIEELK